MQLESQLETLETTRATEARSVRTVDRTVKDLQSQIDRREKSLSLLTDDLSKSRDKIDRLLQTIDELQQSDSSAQLASKRAERELREEREKNLRLERELERIGNVSRAAEGRRGLGAALSDNGSRRGSFALGGSASGGDIKIEVPVRQSSLTKGFL